MRMLLRMYLWGDNKHLRERREEMGERRERLTCVYTCLWWNACVQGGGVTMGAGKIRDQCDYFLKRIDSIRELNSSCQISDYCYRKTFE